MAVGHRERLPATTTKGNDGLADGQFRRWPRVSPTGRDTAPRPTYRRVPDVVQTLPPSGANVGHDAGFPERAGLITVPACYPASLVNPVAAAGKVDVQADPSLE